MTIPHERALARELWHVDHGRAPPNLTGPDKVRGSTDHVQFVVDADRDKPVHLPREWPCENKGRWWMELDG